MTNPKPDFRASKTLVWFNCVAVNAICVLSIYKLESGDAALLIAPTLSLTLGLVGLWTKVANDTEAKIVLGK